MNNANDASVEVRVDTASQIESMLEAAIEKLQPMATLSRQGILVTRLDPGHFSISVSDAVPFGVTLERTR
jgi:hypothetical protein